MDNSSSTVRRLSPSVEKTAVLRLSKIIGQIKSVAAQLEECPRDLSALTQFASANAATGSLMRLIAKDIVNNVFNTDFYDDDDMCSYLEDALGIMLADTGELFS